jgi:hypothetical protein
MSTSVELGIGVGGAVAGALVGFGGSWLVSRQERKAAAKGERRRAYAAYLGTLYPMVSELRDMPNADDRPLPDPIGSLLSLLPNAKATEWLRLRKAVGDRAYLMSAQMAAAYALVQVLKMPDAVSAVISDANEYVIALGATRTPELLGAWPDLHGRLQSAIDLL